jgi:hypothetical protein
MRQLMNPGAARACAALGAVGATTLAVGAHPAAAAMAGSSSPYAVGDGSSFGALVGTGLLPPDPPAKRAQPRRSRVSIAIGRMLAAGDRIARLPYTYGGGHGSFSSSGYDCSGSVSYVLHAARLLSTPEDSSGLESFGDPGPGKHVTVYADSAHAWMTINGRRFDTIALQEAGTRWSSTISSSSGYVVRHPRGL